MTAPNTTPEEPIKTTKVKNRSYDTKRVLRHSFTGKDNTTVDIGRVLWALTTLTYLSISVFIAVKTAQFDPLNFGAGFAAISGGAGAALKLKEQTEPQE